MGVQKSQGLEVDTVQEVQVEEEYTDPSGAETDDEQ